MASKRKSWSLTCFGSRRHVVPLFLKFPTFFLASDADDRKTGALKALSCSFDTQKLPVSSFAVAGRGPKTGFNRFTIRLERKIHLAQSAPDRIGTDLDTECGERRGDLFRGLPFPSSRIA